MSSSTDPLGNHRSWLGGLVRRRVGCPEAVEDVLQEVALAASKAGLIGHPPGETETPPPKPGSLTTVPQLPAPNERFWLCRVALTQSAYWLRRQLRLERRHQNPELKTRAQEKACTDPLLGLMALETRDILRREWVDLDTEHQKVLEMKILEGLSYKEIAQRLGINTRAVEYRLENARRHFRARLIQAGLGDQS